MDTMFLLGITIGAGTLFLIAVLTVIVWRMRRSLLRKLLERAPEFNRELIDALQKDARFRRCVTSGRKIDAIWRLQELTHMGLKEAKDAVDDYFERAKVPRTRNTTPKKAPPHAVTDHGLRRLIELGQIEEAVEAYRLFTGVDVYTARDAVNQMRNERK